MDPSFSSTSSQLIDTTSNNENAASQLRETYLMPIAVVGMGFRGPGDATSVQGLWNMIADVREAWTPVPEDRWTASSFHHPDNNRSGAHHVEGAHFFKQDLAKFDAPFFNLTTAEAAALDPQQRLLLECTYEALENSGTSMNDVKGTKTGVYVGSFCRDYTDILHRDPDTVPMYQCTNSGHSQAILANRISYFFDLRGPSVMCDTACSASLVSLHLACQALRTGDASRAIVAGSNVMLSHEIMITMSMMRMLSPNGRCYTFDNRANGYGRGEGVGCVILKPLHEAIANGDTIRAVIRGSGTNQDGKTSGITLPNGAAQESLIRSVYENAGLDPRDTDFVECHGTGTPAGDAIETSTLAKVFTDREEDRPLRIGSIKTNIGHLEGASGIAGFIKTVLMLENGVFLPNRNFETPNPRIPFKKWNLKVPVAVEAWETTKPRRASVNSFGYGGSNAHIVLEEAKKYLPSRYYGSVQQTLGPIYLSSAEFVESKDSSTLDGTTSSSATSSSTGNTTPSSIAEKSLQSVRLFILSAFDEASGGRQLKNLLTYLTTRTDKFREDFMLNLAYTLNERRTDLKWKAALVADSPEQLIERLQTQTKMVKSQNLARLGFVFTGQGAQWCGMGKELLRTYPSFCHRIRQIAAYLKSIGATYDVEDEILGDPETSKINQAIYSQAMCTAIQIALVDLLEYFGISPASVTGHSSGEIAAAYTAGVLSMEDAMRVAYFRGVVASQIGKIKDSAKGAMMAVGMAAEEAEPYVLALSRGRAKIACINSPSSITISGDESAIDELQVKLDEMKIFARKLAVEVAYHSHHMDQVAADYLEAISGITVQPGNDGIDFFSSVTGDILNKADLGPQYWRSNMVGQVKFAQSVRALCHGTSKSAKTTSRRKGAGPAVNLLVEIGPHCALGGPVKQILRAESRLANAEIVYSSALVRKKDAVETIFDLASTLALNGFPLKTGLLNGIPLGQNQKILTDLPPYSWNHSTSYWAEPRLSKSFRLRSHPRTDILGAPDRNFNPLEPRWRNELRISETPWLEQHKIQSNVIFPAAGYIAMAIEATLQKVQDRAIAEFIGFELRDINFRSALVIPPEGEHIETLFSMKPYSESMKAPSSTWDEFCIFSVTEDDRWTEHCRGLISIVLKQDSENGVKTNLDLQSKPEIECKETKEANTTVSRELDVAKFYERLTEIGLQYGESFANLRNISISEKKCVATVLIADTASLMPSKFEYPALLHPTTLDSIFHTVFAACTIDGKPVENPAVPVHIKELFVSNNIGRAPNTSLDINTFVTDTTTRNITASIRVKQNAVSNQPVLSISGLECMILPNEANSLKDGEIRKTTHYFKWNPDVDLIPSQDMEMVLAGTESSSTQHALSLEDLAAKYLHLLAHKIPETSIMVIGKEKTDLSVISRSLQEFQGDMSSFSNYSITLANTPALEDQIEVPKDCPAQINYQNLDVATPLVEQGWAKKSFGVIFLSDLDTLDGDLTTLLFKLRDILKPGGKLVILDRHAQEDSHVLTNEAWSSALVQAGFSGLDVKIPGVSLPSQNTGTLIVTTLPIAYTAKKSQVLIVADHNVSGLFPQAIKTSLQSLGIESKITTLEHIDPKESVCIVLGAAGSTILSDPSTEQYDALQKIFLDGGGVLWVTLDPNQNPDSSIVIGMSRTIRAEDGQVPIVTLNLDGQNPLSEDQSTGIVLKLFQNLFLQSHGPTTSLLDLEYMERNGILHIPRIKADNSLDKRIASFINGAVPEDVLFQQPGHHFRLELETVGQLDNMYFVEDTRFDPTLLDDHVDIEVRAMGLNFKDIVIALGQIPDSADNMGCECSGIITAIGKTVENVTVGDRVACWGFGAFSSSYRTKATSVQKIPNDMSFELAASLPVAYGTAYYSVFNVARIVAGETVLVHAASGGLGQAIIELCQFVGADVFATVGTPEKKTLLMERFNIPENHIFFSRDGSFKTGILEATAGRGVDVIMNSLAGEALRLTWDCIAPFGRFVELGRYDLAANSRLEMSNFQKNASFTAFNLSYLVKERPGLAEKLWADCIQMFQDKHIKGPSPIKTYPISKIEDALQFMQTGKHIGKLVLLANPGSTVKALLSDQNKQLFRCDASYLLVGGLGGIGRATALWMAENGARNFIIANQSGLAKMEARDAVKMLTAKGATVIVQKCDVSQPSQLHDLLLHSAKTMPPIRGVIQGAMVLRDQLFAKMSLSDYKSVLRPKCQATWNLHIQLPKDLDFFVMLSSISGIIGNATQAAYAAGSTFMDSFAAYRNSLGLPAVSLDLGAISGVGYLSENKELAEAMARQGFETTDLPTLLAIIRSAISNPKRQWPFSQTVTGLGTWTEGESHGSFNSPAFAHFRQLSSFSCSGRGSSESKSLNIRALLGKTIDLDDAAEKISEALRGKIGSRLGIPIEDVSTSKPISDYGVDSLVAVEIRNWIAKEMDSMVPIMDLIANKPLSQLAVTIAQRSTLVKIPEQH